MMVLLKFIGLFKFSHGSNKGMCPFETIMDQTFAIMEIFGDTKFQRTNYLS